MARPSLPTVEKDARRRMRLITPQNCSKVVAKEIFWTSNFLTLFLEKCDDLGVDTPAEGVLMATYGPRLAQRIRIGEHAGCYKTRKEKFSAVVLAYCVLGSLNRRVGAIEAARQAYTRALRLAETEVITKQARGELFRRFGHFKAALRDTEAIRFLDEAVELLETSQYADSLAEAYTTRGCWYIHKEEWSNASRDFRRALLSANQSTHVGKRTIQAAMINLLFSIASDSVSLEEQARVLSFVGEMRSKMSHQRLSRTKAKLLWMEGLLYRNMKFNRHAERVLARAREAFIRVADPLDFTLTTLDLAGILLEEGDIDRYKRLRDDTAAVLTKMAGAEDGLIEILGLWRRSPPVQRALDHVKQRVGALSETRC